MSEIWRFKCLVCDKESEDGLNHGDEILLNILRYIDVINILLDSDKYGYLEISIMGRSAEPISFLMEHYGEGHELVVKSEYGKIKKADKVVHKELLIDVLATLQENSVAANKIKKDLSDFGQLTKFREMELGTITEGSEAAINDIENSLKNPVAGIMKEFTVRIECESDVVYKKISAEDWYNVLKQLLNKYNIDVIHSDGYTANQKYAEIHAFESDKFKIEVVEFKTNS